MKEALKSITEEDDAEDKTSNETCETVVNEDNNAQAEKAPEDHVAEEETSESGAIVKMLITKKQTIAEGECD